MFEEQNICPYTGLRSFTEEESLYFKGRDEHIEQASEMLGKNKFLMLTGASGDGKSSLVYAGIVPNARAGFIKSQYTNWQVADFRPERSPFDNLCSSIAKALHISNPATVQAELQHGFSALVDLYKSSSLFTDKNSEEWQTSSQEEKKELQYKNANLLILVDQFEEFFTNPENYLRGIPSIEANLTLNLLLETAKIALQDDIPIYVAFTMRSDYIGQCAAFRGLPEYIGFSQFFVPRLNRKQLQEVIEEPAVLSGNQISRRLTERLIHDITEGVDQLPILQHSLNQIWKAAEEGRQELDLLHYAKVGGMAPEELPEDQKKDFKKWFNDLPEKIQACYHEPRLQNVLDTHANKIYESAAEYVKEKNGRKISADDAHLIIKTTFTCLTKIDHSRAVRNRMTLQEITEIVSKDDLDSGIVGSVINIFREPGNTFIHPFIHEGEEATVLDPDAVLDITHESLIRNWEMLRDWADEEFEKFTTFADFKQQVDRWIEHNRSWGFLLPIGALTYFEHWYEQTQPNKYWVNRYNEHVTETEKNLDESSEIVENSKAFLKLSGRKHAISRAMVLFGPRRIAAVLALIFVLVFSSFAIYNNFKKQNFYVLNQIKKEGRDIVNEEKAQVTTRAFHLIMRDRTEPGSAILLLEDLDDDYNKFELAVAMAQALNMNDPHGSLPVFDESLSYATKVAQQIGSRLEPDRTLRSRYLHILIELVEINAWVNYYRPSLDHERQLAESSRLMALEVLHLLENPWTDMNFKELNEALETALFFRSFEEGEVDQILELISPFENNQKHYPIQEYMGIEKTINIGFLQDNISFNGLYLQLTALYASKGNVSKTLQAVDTVLKYHPTWDVWSTNYYNLAGYFMAFDHWEELNSFVDGIANRDGINPYMVYRRIFDRGGKPMGPVWRKMAYDAGSENSWNNTVLSYITDRQLDRLSEDFLESIRKNAIGDELHFALAMYFKQIGIWKAKRAVDRGESGWEQESQLAFKKSLESYDLISNDYLNEEITTYFMSTEVVPRRNLYIYPDYREIIQPYAPRSRAQRYYSSAFMEYIIENELFNQLYQSQTDLQLALSWINEYKSARKIIGYFWYGANELSIDVLSSFYEVVQKHPNASNVNPGILQIELAIRLIEEGRVEEGVSVAKDLEPTGLTDLLNEVFFFNNFKTITRYYRLYSLLVVNNYPREAANLMEAFTDDKTFTRMYNRAASSAYSLGNKELGNIYLDSAKLLTDKITDRGLQIVGYRMTHAYALCMQGEDDILSEAKQLTNTLNAFWRYEVSYRKLVRATAFNGKYYQANTHRPAFASSEERLITINQILYGSTYYEASEGWDEFDRNYSKFLDADTYER